LQGQSIKVIMTAH